MDEERSGSGICSVKKVCGMAVVQKQLTQVAENAHQRLGKIRAAACMRIGTFSASVRLARKADQFNMGTLGSC